MKLPISAVILTYNEEKDIDACIRSVNDWADEIFIVDSYSTDKTLEIVRQYTDKIYQNPFENYAQQRNWAQENLPIKNEWVFHLDADERISIELTMELKRIFSSSVDADGFIVARKTIFRKRWIRHGGHYPVYHLRLFKKKRGRCEERLYDQHYAVKGKIERAKGDIINIITPDLSAWRSRHKKWAALEAQEVLFNRNRTAYTGSGSRCAPIQERKRLRYHYYKMPLFIRSFFYFFYRYIIRLGLLDGMRGSAFHFWQGFWYRFLVDTEIYKLKRKRPGQGCIVK